MKKDESTKPKTTVKNMVDGGKKFVSKIPFLNLPDLPLISTTQEELPIADISDDMIFFKDGGRHWLWKRLLLTLDF